MPISRKTPRTRTVTTSEATDLRLSVAQLDIWLGAYPDDAKASVVYLNLVEARRALAAIRAGTPAKIARQLKDDALRHIAYALGVSRPSDRVPSN